MDEIENTKKPGQLLVEAIESKELAERWIRKAIHEDNPAHEEKAKQKILEAISGCNLVIRLHSTSRYEFNKASDLLDEIDGVWR